MNLQKKSVQLLRDLKRSNWLPMYDDKTIKEAVDEIDTDMKEMRSMAAAQGHDDINGFPTEVASGLCLYNFLIERNRRCLLAYLNFRLEKIDQLRWEVGLHVPDDKLAKLHENEKQYFHHINECLDRYMKTYVAGCKETLDLTADAQAPEDMNVQIRVLDDGVGEIMTENSGTLKLKKGWVHMAKRTDVEQLIRAGKVEHVATLRTDDIGNM